MIPSLVPLVLLFLVGQVVAVVNITTIHFGSPLQTPLAVALDSANSVAYVLDWGTGLPTYLFQISLIAGTTFGTVTNVHTGSPFFLPVGIAITSDNTKAYVTDYGPSIFASFWQVSLTPGSTFGTVSVVHNGLPFNFMWGVALNSVNTIAYVTDFGDVTNATTARPALYQVSIVTGSTFGAVTAVHTGAPFVQPRDIAVNSANTIAYITDPPVLYQVLLVSGTGFGTVSVVTSAVSIVNSNSIMPLALNSLSTVAYFALASTSPNSPSLFSVSLVHNGTFGNITAISGTSFSEPAAIVLSHDDNTVYVISGIYPNSTAGLFAVVLNAIVSTPVLRSAPPTQNVLFPFLSSTSDTICQSRLITMIGTGFGLDNDIYWFADQDMTMNITSQVSISIQSSNSSTIILCITRFPSSYLADISPLNVRSISVAIRAWDASHTITSSLSNMIIVAHARLNLSIYDERLAHRMLLHAFVSYGGVYADLSSRWDCSICTSISQPFEFTQKSTADFALDHLFGYTGIHTFTSTSAAFPLQLNNAIVISIRGTDANWQSPQDYWVDAKFCSMIYPNPQCPPHSASVRDGFYGAVFELMNAGLFQSVINLIRSNPNANIFITGHSMGGALATLFAMELMDYFTSLNILLRDQIAVYTFGQPPVGDQGFITCLETLIPAFHRVLHKQDPAPNAEASSVICGSSLPLANTHSNHAIAYPQSLSYFMQHPYSESMALNPFECFSANDVSCQSPSSFLVALLENLVGAGTLKFHRGGYFGVNLLTIQFKGDCGQPCPLPHTCQGYITPDILPQPIPCGCYNTQMVCKLVGILSEHYECGPRYAGSGCSDTYKDPTSQRIIPWTTNVDGTLPLILSPEMELHLEAGAFSANYDPTAALQQIAQAADVPNDRITLTSIKAGSVILSFCFLLNTSTDVDVNGLFLSFDQTTLSLMTTNEIQQAVNSQASKVSPIAQLMHQASIHNLTVQGETVDSSQLGFVAGGDPNITTVLPATLPILSAQAVLTLTIVGTGFLPTISSLSQYPNTIPTSLQAAPTFSLEATSSSSLLTFNATRINDTVITGQIFAGQIVPNTPYTFQLFRENASIVSTYTISFLQEGGGGGGNNGPNVNHAYKTQKLTPAMVMLAILLGLISWIRVVL